MRKIIIIFIVIVQAFNGFSDGTYSKGFWHRIAWGETLSSIAAKYGVDTCYLAHINSIPDIDKIRANRKIWIPGYTLVQAHVYIVREGDFLIGISDRYGVDPWSIASLNGIFDLNRIFPGQRIYIPIDRL